MDNAIDKRGTIPYNNMIYMVLVLLATFSLFSGYIFIYSDTEINKGIWFFVAGMASFIAVFINFHFGYKANSRLSVTDKMVKKTSLISNFFYSNNLPAIHYYPAIQGVVIPVLNVKVWLNRTVLSCIILFSLAFLVIDFNISALLLLVVMSVLVNAAIFFAINIKKYFALLSSTKNISPSYIEMQYHQGLVNELLTKQEIYYYVDKNKDADLLKEISDYGYYCARLANDITTKSPNSMISLTAEVLVIKHAINHFVIDTVRSTNNFFVKYKDKKEAAQTIYFRDVAPAIREEALTLYASLRAIVTLLNQIQKKVSENSQREDEKSIVVGADLMELTRSMSVSLSGFKDFHQLSFNDPQKLFVANSIMSKTIPELMKAKEKSEALEDKEKIDNQIENSKVFVRSIAMGTPESESRKKRLSDADLLQVECGSEQMNEVDRFVAIQQRYINSYDYTLPPNS